MDNQEIAIESMEKDIVVKIKNHLLGDYKDAFSLYSSFCSYLNVNTVLLIKIMIKTPLAGEVNG